MAVDYFVTPFWSNLVVGLGALLGGLGAYYKAMGISHKVDVLRVEIDGKLDKLLEITKEAAYAKGVLAEKERATAEKVDIARGAQEQKEKDK